RRHGLSSPTRRSSDLLLLLLLLLDAAARPVLRRVRGLGLSVVDDRDGGGHRRGLIGDESREPLALTVLDVRGRRAADHPGVLRADRKSTRLNSSHVKI